VSTYRFIAANQACVPVKVLCETLGVCRSGWYAWRRRPKCQRAKDGEALTIKIKRIHTESRQTYGSPRIHVELRFGGERIARKRVERLMRQAGISAIRKRVSRKTTVSLSG